MIRYTTLTCTLLLTALLSTSPVSAGLIVDVTGEVGSGETTWTFSGSYVLGDVNNSADFYSFTGGRDLDFDINRFFHSVGELNGEYASDTKHNGRTTGLVSSAATVTGSSSGSHNLDGLYLDSDGSNGGDDFAWSADGTFTDFETVTFSGSAVLGFDINTFGEGATAIVSPGDTFTVTSTSEITPLSMTFTAVSAVPEPSTIALLSLASMGVFGTRRR